MKTTGRVVCAGALVLVAAALGLRMWFVHEQTWDWRLWPREVPGKVQFAGRDYNCGDRAHPVSPEEEHLVAGMGVQGTTAGGAQILAPSPEAGITIGVKATNGTYVCSLMGGL